MDSLRNITHQSLSCSLMNSTSNSLLPFIKVIIHLFFLLILLLRTNIIHFFFQWDAIIVLHTWNTFIEINIVSIKLYQFTARHMHVLRKEMGRYRVFESLTHGTLSSRGRKGKSAFALRSLLQVFGTWPEVRLGFRDFLLSSILFPGYRSTVLPETVCGFWLVRVRT